MEFAGAYVRGDVRADMMCCGSSGKKDDLGGSLPVLRGLPRRVCFCNDASDMSELLARIDELFSVETLHTI